MGRWSKEKVSNQAREAGRWGFRPAIGVTACPVVGLLGVSGDADGADDLATVFADQHAAAFRKNLIADARIKYCMNSGRSSVRTRTREEERAKDQHRVRLPQRIERFASRGGRAIRRADISLYRHRGLLSAQER
jgi:hypothetical protein